MVLIDKNGAAGRSSRAAERFADVRVEDCYSRPRVDMSKNLDLDLCGLRDGSVGLVQNLEPLFPGETRLP